MTWTEVKRALTTPPPSRPPPPKYPLLTKDVFSTTSFGPGHLVGAGILAVGLVGVTKFFVDRARRRPEDGPKIAQDQNARGEYGNRP